MLAQVLCLYGKNTLRRAGYELYAGKGLQNVRAAPGVFDTVVGSGVMEQLRSRTLGLSRVWRRSRVKLRFGHLGPQPNVNSCSCARAGRATG